MDEIMETIDGHHLAQPPTTRSMSVDFYRGIIERCRTAVEAIRTEMRNEEGDDEGDEPEDDLAELDDVG